MLPVNTKTMFAMLCTYMEKLEKDEINVQQAHAMSKLMNQANQLLVYELKRAVIKSYPQYDKYLRDIEINDVKSLP